MQRMTEDEFNLWKKNKERIVGKRKSSFLPTRKYHNKPVAIDGILFHSTKESERYYALSLLSKKGVITGLTLQPKFVLQEAFMHDGINYKAITYIGDFQYNDRGTDVVEDVKAKNKDGKFYTTEVFNLKKKMFIKKYPHLELRLV